MRWRTLLILPLAHLIASYAGAALLVALAKEVDHGVPYSFRLLLKSAPLAVPRFVWSYVTHLDPPKLLAVLVVLLGYAATFYVLWKLTHRFRIPANSLTHGRGFSITITQREHPEPAATAPDSQ